jgi:hypothetical protein
VLLGGLALLGTVAHAAAIERYDAERMTCPALQALLAAQGKAVLRTPSSEVPGMMLYDVYVARRQACTGQTWPRLRHVATGDRKRCAVYRCGRVTRSSPRY